MTQSISMYSASVPVFKQLLSAMHAILIKAEAHLRETGLSADSLLTARLYEDMFPLTRQIQIATDFSKGVCARLADIDVPVFEDNESSFDDLKRRIEKTIDFISSIQPALIDGSENKLIITRPGTPKEKKFDGLTYLLHYGIPQFFFHITTAYGILRHQGVVIGKIDYMGNF